MMNTLNESIFAQYPDGSKCAEYLADLKNTDNMTWDAVYWRFKYIFEYSGELCATQELIHLANECFNRGLSVSTNKDCYIDARKMAASLYIKAEQYDLAVNCIQVVLDITEDVPTDMLLDLNYAELHTDTLQQVLKSPLMFFNDLHAADSLGSQYLERQRCIIKTLLMRAAEHKSRNPDVQISSEQIEREVTAFGLEDCDEYRYFKAILGAASSGQKKPAPIIHSLPPMPPPMPTPAVSFVPAPKPKPAHAVKLISPTPKPNVTVAAPAKRDLKNRPLEISIFPEDAPIEKSVNEEPAPSPAEARTTTPDSNSNAEALEVVLSAIKEMVSQNAQQIAALQAHLNAAKDDTESAKISEELQKGEEEKKKLLEQLDAAKAKLTLSEEQQAAMAETIAAQTALLDEKNSMALSEGEVKALSGFARTVVFDTCSIENQSDILDYFTDRDAVRVPKTVLDELENHKKNGVTGDLRSTGQRCLKAIKHKNCSAAFDFEDAYPDLLPEAYKVKDNDAPGTINDKYIFSVAIRYKLYGNIPVLLISDDVTVQVWAKSEHIESMSAAEFVAGKRKFVSARAH